MFIRETEQLLKSKYKKTSLIDNSQRFLFRSAHRSENLEIRRHDQDTKNMFILKTEQLLKNKYKKASLIDNN